MRDTSDMMEDALSEDTMMDCEGDGGGLEDLVDLATDIADFSPTIQDAAKRLLTLLGVDEEEDDMLSSSEDEGVEVDVDDTDDEDDDEPENTKLLHQLAASLAQELKFAAQQKQTTVPTRVSRVPRSSFPEKDYPVQSMETSQDANFASRNGQSADEGSAARFYRETLAGRNEQNTFLRSKRAFGNVHDGRESETRSVKPRTTCEPGTSTIEDRRLRMDHGEEAFLDDRQDFTASWGAGWDACAAEALRYLVEDEGLPPYHPTVLAMKNHLDSQRERSFAQYTA